MTTATNDMSAAVIAAEKAQKAAAAAAAKAADAQAIVDRANAEKQAAIDAELKAAATEFIAGFDETLDAARSKIYEAQNTFEELVVTGRFGEIRDAYLTWYDRVQDAYHLYSQLQWSLGDIGETKYKGREVPSIPGRLWPAPFLDALAHAINQGVVNRSNDRGDAFSAKRQALLAGETGGA